MRKRWLLLGVYLLLLAASHLVRALTAPPAPPADVPHLTVPVMDAEGPVPGAGDVRLAYRQWGEAGPGVATVVLLHGSPGDAGNFDRLGPLLADGGLHVLAPDLPGFGWSSRDVPDYSIRAHAHYVDAFLGQLGVGAYHAVGYSMGGGVALWLGERHPARVRSLVLLSSIGVQEHELLGQYHLNHALHGLQVGLLWLARETIPHFGAWDHTFFSLAYARNFYDTDQRPLRGVLESWAGPMLILHAEDDPLVPQSAADEHHRLVPQSELVEIDDSHFTVFTKPASLAEPIRAFVREVEAGEATVRAEAPSARRRAAAEPPSPVPPVSGGVLILFMIGLALATLVSEDLTCIAAGLLVAQGRLDFLPATVACAAGIFFGDLLLYGAGRLAGDPRRAPLVWIVRPEAVDRMARRFEERGAWVIFASRFLPGSRLPIYVTAGLLRVRFLWFAICLLIPVALWTPLLVGLARYFGQRFLDAFEIFSQWALLGIVGIAVLLYLVLKLGSSLASHRGRRLWVGRWRRWTRWEYWPRWVFYPPVVLWILWLGIRYRNPLLFTRANPGMPAGGGFLGESKSEILEHLGGDPVARWRKIPAGTEPEALLAAVDTFLAEHELTLPVVLKPDKGERGTGVRVARTRDQILHWAEERDPDDAAILQEFIDGPELGVFYIRRPGDAEGFLFSITDKRRPTVTGDGEHTLERLILDHPELVAMAPTYLRVNEARLDKIPAEGEEVELVDLGTHCRGAVFYDGSQYETEALRTAVEAVSRRYEGFYFGRYDLRASSYEAFQRGEFKVLELNGVTSEATHIYDPKMGLLDAYRVLFRQWWWAFEVGGG